MLRVVHYCNQFFAGVGGEEAAAHPPERRDGAIGPGRKLAALLDGVGEVVATVFCGDDDAAGRPGAIEEILELVRETDVDLLVAGPAFTSGRYGLACARLAAAAQAVDLPAIAAMHPDNPGVAEAGAAPVIASGSIGREMAVSLQRLAEAVRRFAAGEPLDREAGRIGALPRRNQTASAPAAERAVDLALARLAGDRARTEVPLPRFDQVRPAAPLADPATALLALCTEGALVPAGNPDRLESARATRWLAYELDGRERLAAGEWVSVHGGFSTAWANEDPQRILPLDVARDFERDGRVGRVAPTYFVTAGNGTSVANARRFGVEWAAQLRKAGVQAAILTAT